MNVEAGDSDHKDNEISSGSAVAPPESSPPRDNSSNVPSNNNPRRRRNNQQRQQQQYLPEEMEQKGLIQDEMAKKVEKKFLQFLETFKDENGKLYYVLQLNEMESQESLTLILNWKHLKPETLQSEYRDLADVIQQDFYRYEGYLKNAIKSFIKNNKPNYVQNQDSNIGEDKEFYLSIINFDQRFKLRELVTSKIGQLCSFSATVTRTTEVKPELIYGSFKCPQCDNIINNVPQQFRYTMVYIYLYLYDMYIYNIYIYSQKYVHHQIVLIVKDLN